MANRLYTEEILNEMKNAFGEDILNSIMIVITFPRKGNDYLDKITEELNKQVPKLKKAKFDSKDPIKDQELELKKLLDEVDPYNWTAMEDAKIRINNKAKQLYNDSSNWYNNTHKYIVESNVPTECKNAKENTTKCIEKKKETITCKKPQYTCKNEQTSWNTYKYSPLYIFPETKYIAQEIEKTNKIHSSSSSTKCIKYECIEWKRLHFFSFTYYCVSHKNETKVATKTDVPYDCSYKHEMIVDENEMYCKECEMEYWKKKAWKELNIFNSDEIISNSLNHSHYLIYSSYIHIYIYI